MASQSSSSLEEMAALVAVVDAQGFRAAARKTGNRKATLSKRVQELEARLGVPLLVRTTRSIRLTDEGRAYYERAATALALMRDAESMVVDSRREPRGVLRVSTSGSLAALVLETVVGRYLGQHPNVRVELHVSERRADLARERFDLAIWAGPLGDSSLVARRLGAAVGGYYASPRYLARRPPLVVPEDLVHHDVIVVPKGDAPNEWTFVGVDGPVKLKVIPRLVVTDLELAARGAAMDLGVIRAPQQTVQPYLDTRELVPVLAEATPAGLEVHAVFPAGGTLVPRTRVFVEMMAEWFQRSSQGSGRSAKERK